MRAAAAKLNNPIRVLIADDHRLFAEALEAILAGESSIEVVGRARNGAEALELALQLDPDVVLMDISMPVMDGVEATRRLREARPDACVLMLTGSNAAADVDRAREAGAAGYVTKDRIASQLIEAIVEAAGRLRRGYPGSAMLQFLAVIHVLLSIALVGLILMHSGRDTGFGGMGFTPASQGGTHIVERNLTRLTVVIGILFFANTIALFHQLK